MKVVGTVGSPRKGGNTDVLVSAVLEGAGSVGAAVEKIYLGDLRIDFCDSCETCIQADPNADYCFKEDDMRDLYPKIAQADCLLVGTPVYFFSLSAQTKVFLDRLLPFSTDERIRTLQGKKVALAVVYGDEDPVAAGVPNVISVVRQAADYSNMRWMGYISGQAEDAGELAEDEDLLGRARRFGEMLARG